jgi:hypothetical protein
MLQEKSNLLKFEISGSIVIFVIYFILSFFTENSIVLAVSFLVLFLVLTFISLIIKSLVDLLLRVNKSNFLIKLNKLYTNSFLKKASLFIVQEFFFVFFSLFAAVGLAGSFLSLELLNIIFIYPLAYFVLSIWAKLLPKINKKLVYVIFIFGGFGLSAFLLIIFPFLDKSIVFLFVALGFAPALQIVFDELFNKLN